MISPKKDPQVLEGASLKGAGDGIMYVEEGQSYDEDEYETDSDDSDYSGSDSEGDESGDESDEEIGEIEDGEIEDGEIEDGEIEDGETTEYQSKSEQDTNGVENGEENQNSRKVNGMGNGPEDTNQQMQEYDRRVNGRENGTGSELKNASNESNSKENVSEDSATLDAGMPSELRTDVEKTEAQAKLQTISEIRSLLALAAEHDRVDVIKTLLQSSHPDTAAPNDIKALIQLMLNNRIDEYANDSKCRYAEDDLEKVFLPPLHLAIASSSINAACCFLRMGADPSIRPSVPLNWSGPDYRKAENVESALVVSDWRMFHNLSAWELAFGTMYVPGAVTMEAGKVNEKEGWFRWSSKNATKDDNSTNAKNSPLNIAPSKLEGIRHAFMAEALRAIGSDEVKRLSELINSGIDSASRGSIESSLNNERIEVGGKDLLGWCITMNAVKCSDMLKMMYEKSSDVQENAKDVLPADDNIESAITEVPEDKDEEDDRSPLPSATRLHDLQTQLEEIQSLTNALSTILDDLAEEVSSLQGLLFQNGQSSNSALLSQIRTLKEARIQKEDELEAAERRVGDLENELRMVLMWWTNQGGTEDEIFQARLDNKVSAKRSKNEVVELDERREKELKLQAQIALSENNIQKIRTKISDLAEEKSRSTLLVEKIGLAGAIKLTRTIREETLEMKYALENAMSLETEYCTRIRLIRDRLEKKNHELCSPQEAQVMEVKTTEDIASGCDNELRDDRESIQPTSMNVSTRSTDSQGDEGTEVQEAALNEDNTEVPIQRDENILPSEAISKGASNVIANRVEGYQSHLSINIWKLILRIVSLGKLSFKKAVNITSKENSSHVMIV